MPSPIDNPYLRNFLIGKEQGAAETRLSILELLKSRLHTASCDCYECVELQTCIKLIEREKDAVREME